MTDDMENIEADGPFDPPSEPSEVYFSEDEEGGGDEEGVKEDPTALTGGMGGSGVSYSGHLTGGTLKIPSTITTTTSGGSYTIASGGMWTAPGPGFPVAATPMPALEDIDFPRKVTKKVLIAFIDEDEDDEDANVVWAGNLRLKDVDIHIDPDGDDSDVTITLSLKDYYGDKK